MKLSIIMPVYNSEKYLAKAIDCVINQTFSDFELILVDDGGSDSSPRICDEFAKKYPCITVVHQTNKGIGGARNTGMDMASGDYIGFMDNDDLIHPQMFEILMFFALNESADLVMFPEKWVSEDFQIPDTQYNIPEISFSEKTQDYMYRNMFSESASDTPFVTIWNKVFSAEIASDVRFPLYGTEDSVFNCFAYSKSKKNISLDIEPDLYYWVQRASSTSHHGFTMYHCMSLKSYFEMEQFVYQNVPDCSKYALDKTFRKILSFRYDSKGTELHQKTKDIISEFYPGFKKRFAGEKEISAFRKILYFSFYNLPVTYALFRRFSEWKAQRA